jgi:immunity protein 26 of polymorphic toxin system
VAGWVADHASEPQTGRVPPLYPFTPRSNAQLDPGQFWSIPLADGRFGCGRVLRLDRDRAYGARILFVGALLDWVGESSPTAEAIAGRPLLGIGVMHVRAISYGGGLVVGERPLEADGIEPPIGSIGTHWGDGYPTLRAEQRFIKGDPPPTSERRVIEAPLTDEMLRPSPTGRGVVQFRTQLTDDEFVRLADWMAQYPEMMLRVYGSYDGSIQDLEFLRFFPTLRRFDADALHSRIRSLDGLRHLPEDAEELAIGDTTPRQDLAILRRFRRLKSLWLEGHTRHIEVISELTALKRLSIRSITLPDLSLMLPLRSLRALEIKLGGTTDLRLLPRIGEVRYLELWLIRGLDDIAPIGRMGSLRSLFLQALKRVERLPDFSEASNLRRVHLMQMKGLRDLRPLTTAPALEELLLVEMPHLQPDDLRPLQAMPRLRAVTLGLGGRKNDMAKAMLGLPPVTEPLDWRD